MERDSVYEHDIDWLFKQFPSYQTLGAVAYKPDIGTISVLLEQLNHPEKNLRFIHIAGTNGKGSTSSMLASILTEAGEKVGLFTSPHLFDFRERIRVNGEMISCESVSNFCSKIRSLEKETSPSFFEITLAMALEHFSNSKCTTCVIETGMGGRLDATNVIQPLVSIITTIGLDHTQFLGESLASIATEKAGIIKTNTPVIIGETQEETKAVFTAFAHKLSAPITFADQEKTITHYDLPLLGNYQKNNLRTVLSTLKVIKDQLPTSERIIQKGLDNLRKNTGFFGRMQQINNAPQILIDVSHNTQGISATLDSIQILPHQSLHIVYGASTDKDINEILTLFPKNASVCYSIFSNQRSRSAEDFEQLNSLRGENRRIFPSINTALTTLQSSVNKEDIILVIGSFFLISDLNKDFSS